MVKRISPGRRVFSAVNGFLFLIMVLLCAYPLWYIFVQSLSGAILPGKSLLVPYEFTLMNYSQVFSLRGVSNAVSISVARTVLGTCATTMCCMLLGFFLSKQDLPFRRFFYRMLTITMYLSGGLIPTYLTIKAYGLLNNFWVYVVPYAISAYYVILIKTYLEQLPPSIEESASIDGAGVLRVFFHIILPMSLPIVATIGIYAAVAQWNAWFDNNIYTFSVERLTTMQYMLYRYLNEAEAITAQLERSALEIDITQLITPKGVRMTITMITVFPVLMVYPFLQRYFIKGIFIGAVKG